MKSLKPILVLYYPKLVIGKVFLELKWNDFNIKSLSCSQVLKELIVLSENSLTDWLKKFFIYILFQNWLNSYWNDVIQGIKTQQQQQQNSTSTWLIGQIQKLFSQ